MRTIKFRGKQAYGGADWKYGNLCGASHYAMIEEVIQDKNNEKTYWTPRTQVIPETVGQFTGLYDKNGKEIYEGDIVSYIIATGGIEDLGIKSKTCFVVQYNDKKAAFEFGFTNGMNEAYNLFNGYLQHHKLVVIGNVYDNRELLKG